MAAPLITALAAPTTAIVGQPFDVDVLAEDPSARPVTLTATVTNSAGEATSQSATVEVGSGPVTFTLTSDDPHTVITAGQRAGSFTVTC